MPLPRSDSVRLRGKAPQPVFLTKNTSEFCDGGISRQSERAIPRHRCSARHAAALGAARHARASPAPSSAAASRSAAPAPCTSTASRCARASTPVVRRRPASEVTTIEGPRRARQRRRCRRRGSPRDVPQCGYCQSGQIMCGGRAAQRQRRSRPTRDIDAAMNGNICRCAHLPAHPRRHPRRRRARLKGLSIHDRHTPRRASSDAAASFLKAACRGCVDRRLASAARARRAVRRAQASPAATRRSSRTPSSASAPTTPSPSSASISRWARAPTPASPTLVAEELDADWSQMRVECAPADAKPTPTRLRPVQGTGGSTAIANSYEQLRKAGAAARAMLVAAAAQTWNVPAAEITVESGVVEPRSGKTRDFGAARRQRRRSLPVPAEVDAEGPEGLPLIGNDASPRLDSADKTNGTAQFTHRRQAARHADAPWSRTRRASAPRSKSVRRRAAPRRSPAWSTSCRSRSGVAVVADRHLVGAEGPRRAQGRVGRRQGREARHARAASPTTATLARHARQGRAQATAMPTPALPERGAR